MTKTIKNKNHQALEIINSKDKRIQRLQDQNNLKGRQLRALNRKDNWYDIMTNEFRKATKGFKFPKHKKITFEKNASQFKVLVLSDIHADESITKAETAGAEVYNFDICKKRLKSLEGKIIQDQLGGNKAPHLTIFLIGDILSGMIHEELYENGQAGVIEMASKTSLLLATFINNLSPYFKKIYIYTKPGNHGRFAKEIKFKRTDENWDNVIYLSVKAALANNSAVQMVIDTSYFNIVTINGKKFGYTHGDKVNAEKLIEQENLDFFLQ